MGTQTPDSTGGISLIITPLPHDKHKDNESIL